MYHFFVATSQIADGYAVITGQDVNHIRNVLRMKAGEKIGVRDGISRNYICELETMEPEFVRARILSEETDSSELPARLYLFQGLPKGDKMELIIQKAVELGACEIIPVATRRSVVKLDKEEKENKVRRWNAIAESAAKQSGRMQIPEVKGVMTLAEAFSYSEKFEDQSDIPTSWRERMEKTRGFLAESSRECRQIYISPESGILTGRGGGCCEKGNPSDYSWKTNPEEQRQQEWRLSQFSCSSWNRVRTNE